MNLEKARDYFSAYYEGSLDRGLKQALESSLKDDAQLQAEYRSFESTMRDLEETRFEIEMPADLHERISARLDRHRWEEKQKARPAASLWLKRIGLGVLGVAAVAAIAFIVPFRTTVPTATANAMPGLAKNLSISADKERKDTVNLSYPGAASVMVIVRDAGGKVLDKVNLGGQAMNNKPLRNPNAEAQIVSVEVNKQSTLVALPGTVRSKSITGKGTVKDFALGMASFYGIPFVLQVEPTTSETQMNWKIESAEAVTSASQNVEELGLHVEQKDQIIWITQEH